MSGLETAGDPGAREVAWFLHGILGRGRNFRTLARRLAARIPNLRVLLPDLRCHGEAAPADPPHDLAACARDLNALAEAHGPPRLVIGHSFGGKVALKWAEGTAEQTTDVWVLDSPPGPVDRTRIERALSSDVSTDPARILALLRSIETPAPSREALRAPLLAAAIPEPIVAWLLTSAEQREDGWVWMWDLDGVRSMLLDYADTDFWPYLQALPEEAPNIHLVRAGRSDRWSPRDLELFSSIAATHPKVSAHLLPKAGHWLHVDDPDGLLSLLAGSS